LASGKAMIPLFNIVEKPSNYAFGDNMTHHSPWGSYKICLLFTYSICYWEASIHFPGAGDEFYTMGRIFHGEGSLQGVNFSGEILHRGNLPEFPY